MKKTIKNTLRVIVTPADHSVIHYLDTNVDPLKQNIDFQDSPVSSTVSLGLMSKSVSLERLRSQTRIGVDYSHLLHSHGIDGKAIALRAIKDEIELRIEKDIIDLYKDLGFKNYVTTWTKTQKWLNKKFGFVQLSDRINSVIVFA